MVWKKKYLNFYLLTFLSGARRQIFVVFALFLMVKKFKFTAGEVALLYLLNNLINIFILPKIAFVIDKIGEKRTLTIEYLILIPLFISYAYATSAWMVALLFIIDNMIFYFSIALKTYFQKIADKDDIAPTNAVSFTINHIAAIFIPVLGGLLWMYNYRIPFILGTFIGLCSLFLARRISLED
jgi:MFS family permease